MSTTNPLSASRCPEAARAGGAGGHGGHHGACRACLSSCLLWGRSFWRGLPVPASQGFLGHRFRGTSTDGLCLKAIIADRADRDPGRSRSPRARPTVVSWWHGQQRRAVLPWAFPNTCHLACRRATRPHGLWKGVRAARPWSCLGEPVVMSARWSLRSPALFWGGVSGAVSNRGVVVAAEVGSGGGGNGPIRGIGFAVVGSRPPRVTTISAPEFLERRNAPIDVFSSQKSRRARDPSDRGVARCFLSAS